MRAVKNINNNVSLCLDSQGREVIALGKGIGFSKPPYEIPLNKIERTFYDVNPSYLSVIAEIPEEIVEITTRIVDYANSNKDRCYTSHLILTLADHIQFTIKRAKNGLAIKLPLLYEVQQLYPDEMELGLYSLQLINSTLDVSLPREEAANIALHFVQYSAQQANNSSYSNNSAVEKCADVIEKEMNVKIDKTGFHYFRFVTHVYYLLDRAMKQTSISSDNEKMFLALKEECPATYQCALSVKKTLGVDFNDEEILYLILHINRLCI